MAQTILLVDNDRLFVDAMRQRLLDIGYRVLCAQTKAEAEIILAQSRPDVLVSEVMLEQPDAGFCLAWSAKQRYPELPVLLVSAVTWHAGLYFSLSRPEDNAWIKADAFIDKPIRNEELESAIRRSLHLAARPSA